MNVMKIGSDTRVGANGKFINGHSVAKTIQFIAWYSVYTANVYVLWTALRVHAKHLHRKSSKITLGVVTMRGEDGILRCCLAAQEASDERCASSDTVEQ